MNFDSGLLAGATITTCEPAPGPMGAREGDGGMDGSAILGPCRQMTQAEATAWGLAKESGKTSHTDRAKESLVCCIPNLSILGYVQHVQHPLILWG